MGKTKEIKPFGLSLKELKEVRDGLQTTIRQVAWIERVRGDCDWGQLAVTLNLKAYLQSMKEAYAKAILSNTSTRES